MALGDIIITYHPITDDKYVLCDGSSYFREGEDSAREFYQLVGGKYGKSDSWITVNVPNLMNKIPIGPHGTDVYLGEASVTLQVANLPSHTHTYAIHGLASASHQQLSYMSGGNYGAYGYSTGFKQSANTGGSQSHENRQPFITCYYYIQIKEASTGKFLEPIDTSGGHSGM